MKCRVLPLFAAVSAVVACADEDSSQESGLRTVGEYQSVRVEAPVRVRVASDATLGPDQVGVDCEELEYHEGLQTEQEDGVLVIRYASDDPDEDLAGEDDLDDADAEEEYDCSILIYGGGGVSVQIADQEGELDMTIEEDGDVQLGDVNADSLNVTLNGEGDLHIDSVTVQDASVGMTANNALTIDSLHADTLTSDTTAQSVVTIHDLDVGSWTLKAAGGSSIWASGYADRLSIHARGNSRIDADEVKANDVVVDASGNSEVSVTALDSASIDAGGNAAVSVGGDPEQATIDAGGSADVTEL